MHPDGLNITGVLLITLTACGLCVQAITVFSLCAI